MNNMSTVKKLCLCAICTALCYVLPIMFHAVGLGSTFSPIHIPVYLCGLICGGFYGGFCGLAGPVLSSVLSGMPPATALVTMLPELLVYGTVSGAMMARVRTGKPAADLYISMGTAMILGRIVAGIAKVIYVNFFAAGDAYTVALWVSSYFISSFPGILAHLILVPVLVGTLRKSRLIPTPTPKTV